MIKRRARYFPSVICQAVKGLVRRVSNVPLLYSSEKLRMLMAGTRKRSTQGAREKNLSKLAYPKTRILLSSKIKRNKPFTSRNKTIAI
jgi:hypothetical protein